VTDQFIPGPESSLESDSELMELFGKRAWKGTDGKIIFKGNCYIFNINLSDLINTLPPETGPLISCMVSEDSLESWKSKNPNAPLKPDPYADPRACLKSAPSAVIDPTHGLMFGIMDYFPAAELRDQLRKSGKAPDAQIVRIDKLFSALSHAGIALPFEEVIP
jgi:hypothetical protein